jgi:hypothetical protein
MLRSSAFGEDDIGKSVVRNQPDRKDISMPTQVDQSPHLLVWIASVATTFFCAAGFAAFMAWMPTAIGNPEDRASDTPTRTTCAGCAVIESVREIDTHGEHATESTRGYATTIRLRDGSRRVFIEATPRTWRSGTRVMVID